MRGLLPRAVCPVISGSPDAGVSHPSSERLRRPPSPSRGEGTVGRPLEEDGGFSEAALAPVIVGMAHAATVAGGRSGVSACHRSLK
jgi:hypothetical protein